MMGRLVIMGGGTPRRDDDRAAGVEHRVDPEAAAEVFAAWAGRQRLPIVCGLDLTRTIAMTPDMLARLAPPGRHP